MQILINLFTQLGVNQTILFQAAIFVFTFFLVSFLALNRLTETLVERDHRIEGREQETKKLTADLEETRNKLSHETLLARKQAADIFQDLKAKAVAEQKAILAASRETAMIEVKTVRTQIMGQLAEEIKKVELEVPNIARLLLEKISGGRAIPAKVSTMKKESPREV
jgi:F0F1-type ATP synthase membrane subunit b/b'